MQKPAIKRKPRHLAAAPNPQLGRKMLDMLGDGAGADRKARGDIVVGTARGQQGQDIKLSRGHALGWCDLFQMDASRGWMDGCRSGPQPGKIPGASVDVDEVGQFQPTA